MKRKMKSRSESAAPIYVHYNMGVSPGDNGLLPRSLAGNHYVYVYWAGSVSEISPLFSS